jgi:opacity protein-like surface antigen
MRHAWLTVLLLSLPAVASADPPTATVTLTPQGQALATSLGETPAQLQTNIQNQVNDAYQTADIGTVLRSFTDATAFSNRGLGVDYASASDDFMIGIAGDVALASPDALDEAKHGDTPTTGGGAANFGIMLGGKLSSRWMLFGNGFYESASTSKLAGDLTSAGAHLQYRLVKPETDGGGAVVLRWIGIDLTSGVEYTRWKLGLNDTLTNDYTVGSGQQSTSLNVVSAGTFNLTSQTVTIPLEATTGLRILELLSVYIGGGVDFTTGKTSIDVNLDGTAKASDGTAIGDVKIAGTSSNTGSPAALRALAGVQLNLWRLKVFAQGNLSQNSTASLSFGLRLLL